MPDGNSVINLSGLAKPATILIEKISNAVGVLYEPRRIIKKAEAEAKAKKIKAIAGIELSQIQQRGIERLVHQEGRKQENIENITAQAVKQLPPQANTGDLEEDWIVHFFDRCEKVSDEKMQLLWSNLLAGEATKPGSYSKRTVDIVASISKKEAELFTKFCQFIWMIDVYQQEPLIFDIEDDIYTSNGVNFSALKHLDFIGLISFTLAPAVYTLTVEEKSTLASYFGLQTLIEHPKEEGNIFNIGQVLLTQTGRELATICGAQRSQEFYEYAIKKLSSQGAILSSRI